ncbi:MAG: ChaN family lipoprotein [Azonexus sp.]
MIKLSFAKVWVSLLLVGASLSVLALATSRSERIAPAACGETGRWLSFNGKQVRAVTATGVIADAASNEVVLLGEQHDVEDHHRWQLQVLSALHAQRPDLVIGFEMFPRRVQPVLDRWVAGKMSTREFLAQAEWDQIWNFPPQFYLPLFEFARINRIPMLALNVDQKLARAISEKGWESVPIAEREGIGRAAAPSPAYREFLRDMHRVHAAERGQSHGRQGGKSEPSFENFVAAQLTWDRAMAEALAKPLRAGSEGRPLVVGIMGSGHIRFRHGVEHQLRDLGIRHVASLLPASLQGECQDLQAGLADAIFVLPEKPQTVPEPPRLGVTLDDDNKGLRIAQVQPGSLAEKSGLQAGDRILEMAGRPSTNSNEAVTVIRRQPPGTWLPLRVARNDTQLDVVIRFPASP